MSATCETYVKAKKSVVEPTRNTVAAVTGMYLLGLKDLTVPAGIVEMGGGH